MPRALMQQPQGNQAAGLHHGGNFQVQHGGGGG
jgi:hypothetical protein